MFYVDPKSEQRSENIKQGSAQVYKGRWEIQGNYINLEQVTPKTNTVFFLG